MPAEAGIWELGMGEDDVSGTMADETKNPKPLKIKDLRSAQNGAKPELLGFCFAPSNAGSRT